MSIPFSSLDTSQTTHAKGPGALAFLRSKIDPQTLSVIPETLEFSRNDRTYWAPLRLRLAYFKHEGTPGIIWAYITPHSDPYKTPGLHMGAEFKTAGSEGMPELPVPSKNYLGSQRHVPDRLVLELMGAETREELTAFVCYVFLLAAHNGECEHYVPIDAELVRHLTSLCRRPAFQARMRQTQDGSGPDTPVSEKRLTKLSKSPQKAVRDGNVSRKFAPANMESSTARRDDDGDLRMLDRSGGSKAAPSRKGIS